MASWLTRCVPLLFATGGVVIVGCTDQPSEPSSSNPPAAISAKPTMTQNSEREFVAVERVRPTLTAVGPFRPGRPIRILSGLETNRLSGKVKFEVLSLDEPDSRAATATAQGRHHQLRQWSGAMARGNSQRFSSSLSFASPGYYRVMIVAVSEDGAEALPTGDTLVINHTARTVRILVDDQGGRVTDEFDSLAITGRHPQFGSYGPFVSERVANQPRVQAGFVYSGHVSYFNRQTSQQVPMPDMAMGVSCGWHNTTFNIDMYDVPITTRTNTNGDWSQTCPTNRPLVNIIGNFGNTYSFVKGKDGAMAGLLVSDRDGGTFPDMRVANDDAAATYLLLSRRIPQAFSKFGASRGPIDVYVAQGTANNTYGPVYNTSDVIKTNFLYTVAGASGNKNAEFSTMHEYGHAFQYKAIENWAANDCGSDHFMDGPETLSCAFVEGFADFFGVWVGGDAQTTGDFSDNGIETNRFRSLGDGSIIEGATAAFFYDLVDGTAERDNSTNTGKFSEPFDQVTYPGSYLVAVIKTCSLNSNFGTFSQMGGIDQVIYCLERSLSAQSLTQYFPTDPVTYTSVTEGATEPPTWNSADIRRLWLYNLYNVGP